MDADGLRAYEIIVDTLEMVSIVTVGIIGLVSVGRWIGRLTARIDALAQDVRNVGKVVQALDGRLQRVERELHSKA